MASYSFVIKNYTVFQVKCQIEVFFILLAAEKLAAGLQLPQQGLKDVDVKAFIHDNPVQNGLDIGVCNTG